jgi:hypothetical protein
VVAGQSLTCQRHADSSSVKLGSCSARHGMGIGPAAPFARQLPVHVETTCGLCFVGVCHLAAVTSLPLATTEVPGRAARQNPCAPLWCVALTTFLRHEAVGLLPSPTFGTLSADFVWVEDESVAACLLCLEYFHPCSDVGNVWLASRTGGCVDGKQGGQPVTNLTSGAGLWVGLLQPCPTAQR